MTLSNRNRKRILIFLIVPVLITIFFFTEDLVLKIITAVILLIYVGFIIFLRDSIKMEGSFPYTDSSKNDESIAEEEDIAYETDEGEGFKIISGSKDLDVITSDTFNPSVKYRPKNIFKPPDLKENFDKIATEELPSDVNHDEQFAFVLAKILTVIKEAYLAHSSVYFWYNKSKERLTLEKYVSSSNDITERKFKIEDDILSKIVQKEEPELLTDITPNAEKDVIRYYNSPQGIRSFVGVPLFYGKKLAGVLALDSKEGDAFGIESIYSLGRIVRVISILISLFEDKYR